MTVTTEQALYAFGVFSSVTTAIFWGSFLLGRLHARMERVEMKIGEHDHVMERAGQKMSDLADEVQKMPEKFLTRSEALMWRGSRAEDR